MYYISNLKIHQNVKAEEVDFRKVPWTLLNLKVEENKANNKRVQRAVSQPLQNREYVFWRYPMCKAKVASFRTNAQIFYASQLQENMFTRHHDKLWDGGIT